MDRIASWLCPTEEHRARALEAGERVRKARTMAGLTCGIAVVATAPFLSWWYLLLFGATAAVLGTVEWRLDRSDRPELVAAEAHLMILALLAVAVALSGGESSPALPWMILPVANSAARFRPTVVIALAGITAAVMFGVSVGVDPQGVADDPTRLIATLTLLIAVTAMMTTLMEGELEHRDRAVLDPMTGLLNRASLGARVHEIEEQAHLTGGAVSVIVLAACYRELTLKALIRSLDGALRVTVMAFLVILGSATFAQVLAFTGASSGLMNWAIGFKVGPLGMLLIMIGVIVFLGSFMDPLSKMLLTAPIFFPLAKTLGFDLTWFGLIMLLALEMGYTMPPFGLLLFVMKGVSPPGTRMRDIYLAGLPFIACVVLLILMVIYIPPLATWLPKVSR